MNKEAVNAAVQWWVKQLEKPTFDNGDDSLQGVQTKLLWNTLQMSRDAITEEQKEVFVNTLTELIHDNRPQFIDVDYNPDRILSRALSDARIEGYMSLPIKTTMWINDDEVKVSLGYKAPIEVIWTKEG